MPRSQIKDEKQYPRKELDRIPSKRRFAGKEIDTAVQLIESLSIPWKPGDHRDTYTEKVEKLIRAKRGGKDVTKESDRPDGCPTAQRTATAETQVQKKKASKAKKAS